MSQIGVARGIALGFSIAKIGEWSATLSAMICILILAKYNDRDFMLAIHTFLSCICDKLVLYLDKEINRKRAYTMHITIMLRNLLNYIPTIFEVVHISVPPKLIQNDRLSSNIYIGALSNDVSSSKID